MLYVKKRERDERDLFFLESLTFPPRKAAAGAPPPPVPPLESLSRKRERGTKKIEKYSSIKRLMMCLRKTDSLLLETMNERREKLDARRQRSTRRRENVDFLLLLARARVRAYL